MPDSERAETFETWAVVELFGHKQIAGKVSEQVIGGCTFVRVDVPATTDRPAYSKMYGNGAIYCITPVVEEIARLAAHEIEKYNNPIPVALPKALPAATGGQGDGWRDSGDSDSSDDDDDDDRPF